MRLSRVVAGGRFVLAFLGVVGISWFVLSRVVSSSVTAGGSTFSVPPGWSVGSQSGFGPSTLIRSPDGQVQVGIGGYISCGLPIGPTQPSPGDPEVAGLSWDWCNNAFVADLGNNVRVLVTGPIKAIQANHADIQKILTSERRLPPTPSSATSGKWRFIAPRGWTSANGIPGFPATIASPDGQITIKIGSPSDLQNYCPKDTPIGPLFDGSLPTPEPQSGDAEITGVAWDTCTETFLEHLDTSTVVALSGPAGEIRQDHTAIQGILDSAHAT